MGVEGQDIGRVGLDHAIVVVFPHFAKAAGRGAPGRGHPVT